MRHSLQKYNESGMTLVEILISMLIGAVLLAGVLSIFINSKQTYQRQEGMSRIQENGRFALDFIARDLRMGDFWGCMRPDAGGPNNNINLGVPPSSTFNFYDAGGFGNIDIDGDGDIDGIDIDGDGNVDPDEGGAGAVADSGQDAPDILTIRGLTSAGVFITTASANPTAALTATGHGFAVNDLLFVTNCNNGDFFQATAVTATTISHAAAGAPGNSQANLSATYGTDAQVYGVSTIVYSIAPGASGLPSLFRSINGLNQELIEGVENMQVLYGVDNNPADDAAAGISANYYVAFDQIPNQIPPASGNPGTDRIISVRISLLLQSTDNNITTQNTAVAYNGGTSVADRRLRRVVTSTIALRNRL